MAGPFTRAPDGSIAVLISEHESRMLADIAAQVEGVLDQDGEDTRRLYPRAYDDPDQQRSFDELTRDDLTAAKRRACGRMADSIEEGAVKRGAWRGTLDDETAHAWLTVLNDARLVLGTRIGVTEEMDHSPRPEDDPEAQGVNLYLYLSAIQEGLIDALASGVVGADDTEPR